MFTMNDNLLRIGARSDRWEQNANRTADAVLQRCPIHDRPGRLEAAPGADHGFRGGAPLPANLRSGFETSFGHDFSRVRVHADSSAAAIADGLHAQAFTAGSDIVFGAGQYAPETSSGKRLLAHELTHVVQQRTESAAPEIQRDELPGAEKKERPGPPAAGAAGGTALNIEFHAFIPAAMGKAFSAYPQYTGLKNQAAYNAAVAAVPGTWLIEPGEMQDKGAWYCGTDERGFGGGSHRVGFAGTVNASEVGSLGAGRIFSHSCDASHRVRAKHTGTFTSTNETGSVEGPLSKIAIPTSSEDPAINTPGASKVKTTGKAAYAFMPRLSPNIDYTVALDLRKTGSGGVEVSGEITRNKFPFYEMLVNKTTVYSWSSPDPGPTLINLNSSETEKIKAHTF
jgi:hypothetical protein